MENKLFVALLSYSIIAFILMIISLIVGFKMRKSITKKGKIIKIISIIIFLFSFFTLSPILLTIGIHLVLGIFFDIILVFFGLVYIYSFFIGFGSGSTNTSSTSTNTSNNDNHNEEEKPDRVDYCHYDGSRISTIYENDTVIRDDGLCGFRKGDYIYYDDGTTGHIVMLNDETGIIE